MLLACLFEEKVELLCLLGCRPRCAKSLFNVAYYSKSTKDINTKLGILAHHNKVHLRDKGHNLASYSYGVMSLVMPLIKYNI